MLPATSALRAASRSISRPLVARRNGSSSSNHHDDHGSSGEDYRVPENFGNATWRNTVLAGLALVAFYKYAPEPNADVYLTRFINLYTAPRDWLLDLNATHTVLSQDLADHIHLLQDAQKPTVMRFRYPQGLGKASPFNNGVGMNVDMSDVQVKTNVC